MSISSHGALLGLVPAAKWFTAACPSRRHLQVRAMATPQQLDSMSSVVSDKTVPEGHTGLHGFLYGEGGAEVHDDHASKVFQGRPGEDDGTTILSLQDYVSAREGFKLPGVYAVYNESESVQYVGFSRNVVLSLKTHRGRLGDESCSFVRVKLFGDPSLVTKTKLEEERQKWIDELAPPGNLENDSLWEAGVKTQKAKAMSEKEREDYEEKKLKLRKAMGENLHDDVEGEDEGSKMRRLKLLQAVEGDNWSSVINGQSMETLADKKKPEVISPFATQSTAGLYSAETYDFTMDNVDKVLNEVRPYLIADGGNVAVVSIADGVVSLELQGACGTCPSSTSTMKMGIERVLREKFGDAIKEVVDANKPSLVLSFEAVNTQIDVLRTAIVGYGGSVELASVDPVKGECYVKYKGPVPLGLGIKAVIRDKFPDLNIVLVDPEA